MKHISITWVILIQWILGYEWLHSGWGKIASPGFMDNISNSLTGFASKTPYTTYGQFLQEVAIPNANTFGNLIRGGEVAVGLCLVLAGALMLWQKRLAKPVVWLAIIALLAGAVMNLNFYLAAGWSSPSTWGINVVMGLIHIVLAGMYITNRKSVSA